MGRLRRLLFLLRPSLISFTVCAIADLLFLMVVNWAFVAHNQLLYTYFFGPYGLATVFQGVPVKADALWHGFLTQPLVREGITYFLVLFIAVVIFSLLEGGSKAFSGVANGARDLRDSRRLHLPVLYHTILIRIIVRIFIVALWSLYTVAFFVVIVPYVVAQARFGIATIAHWENSRYVLGAILLLFAALHGHVIFARLLALHPRLFGGVTELLESEHTTK